MKSTQDSKENFHHFQFEQPIYNPWQHRRCSIDEETPHTIIVTTASSTHSSPNPSFRGSLHQTNFDEDDLEIQDWCEIDTDSPDPVEDEEDRLERHLQWQRAHRFLAVIAKWRKSGQRPRAFSDPELFASQTTGDAGDKKQIKENFTLM